MEKRPHIPDDVAETPEEREWFASKPRDFVDAQAKVEREAEKIEERERRREHLEWVAEQEVAEMSHAIEKIFESVGPRMERLARNAMLAGVLFGGTSFAAPPDQREPILEAERTSEAWEGLPSQEEMLDALREAYGREAVRVMLPTETPEDRDWGSEPVAEVGDDFEQFGIERAELQRYLREGFPRFMTARGTVDRIVYADERYPVPASYGLRSDVHALASCANAPGREAAVVTYYIDAFEVEGTETMRDVRAEALRDTLPHELAHAVDWQDMADIDPARRVEILYRLTRLVQDEQFMLQFGYAENIENPDPHQRLRDRATEYFADLVAAVFEYPLRSDMNGDLAIFNVAINLGVQRAQLPEDLARLPPQDERVIKWEEEMFERTAEAVRLVYDYIHAMDPDFDFAAARETRLEIRREIETADQDARLRALLERIPERLLPTVEATRRHHVGSAAETAVAAALAFAVDDTLMDRVRGLGSRGRDPQVVIELMDRVHLAERNTARWVDERNGEFLSGMSQDELRMVSDLLAFLNQLSIYDTRGENPSTRAYDLQTMEAYENSARHVAAELQPPDADPFATPGYPESVLAAVDGIARLYRGEDPPPRELADEWEHLEQLIASEEYEP